MEAKPQLAAPQRHGTGEPGSWGRVTDRVCLAQRSFFSFFLTMMKYKDKTYVTLTWYIYTLWRVFQRLKQSCVSNCNPRIRVNVSMSSSEVVSFGKLKGEICLDDKYTVAYTISIICEQHYNMMSHNTGVKNYMLFLNFVAKISYWKTIQGHGPYDQGLALFRQAPTRRPLALASSPLGRHRWSRRSHPQQDFRPLTSLARRCRRASSEACSCLKRAAARNLFLHLLFSFFSLSCNSCSVKCIHMTAFTLINHAL